MEIQESLKELGAVPSLLTAGEREFLDEQGYLPIPAALSADQVEELRRRVDLLLQLEGDSAGKEFRQEPGALRLCNLIDKGEIFRIAISHPKVLAAISHVLGGDLKLSSLNFRNALPGQGLQNLHTDWNGPLNPGIYEVCNSLWLLDDFTTENGATRIVPGSHRSGKKPQELMADQKADHPDQKLLIALAGTVVVMNSHAWHGGTVNKTALPRRAFHAYYTRRKHPQQMEQRRYLSPVTIDSISPAMRCILDV